LPPVLSIWHCLSGDFGDFVGHLDRRISDRYGRIRMQANRAAIEYPSHSDILKDTGHEEAKNESHVTVDGTVPPKIPVYSDVSFDLIEGRKIGSSGFEPLTPTVSKDEAE
jgi:hypothetical protein